MTSNKFDKFFDSNESPIKLSNIYFSYCEKVNKNEKQELTEAYIKASNIAEKRELDEACQGIFH